jgi:hypothetical protein
MNLSTRIDIISPFMLELILVHACQNNVLSCEVNDVSVFQVLTNTYLRKEKPVEKYMQTPIKNANNNDSDHRVAVKH